MINSRFILCNACRV